MGKAGVVGGQEALGQVAIRGGGGGDAAHGEVVGEPILEGAVEAFAAAAGLRRVGGDVLNAEARQGTADLGASVAVHGRPGLRVVECPAGAIGVQGLGQAVGLEGAQEGLHHGGGGLGGNELSVEDAL